MHIKKQFLIYLFYLIFISCNDKKENNTNEAVVKDSLKTDTLANINTSKALEKDTLSNNTFESDNDISGKESLGELKYGLAFHEVIRIYGKPNTKTKAELWTGDGEYHQTVKYHDEGIELDLIGNSEETKKVNMIKITNPSELKTLKNIGIGSDFNDVEEAYKDLIDKDFSNSEAIVVGSIYGGVIFSFENNKVISIFIGAMAE